MQSSLIDIPCADGIMLMGHHWRSARPDALGIVVVNPATGVKANYYHPYARFLAAHGFDVITYDYRGIGLSRPERLARCGWDWRHWGERDAEAVLGVALASGLPVSVVGHSIGGILPGYAPSASGVRRMLTIGAQYAWWRDYPANSRQRMYLKWHVLMPVVTMITGYFPGRRWNWLEDLPDGVAYQWGLGGAELEARLAPTARADIHARFAAIGAPILAVGVTDDPFGTRAAISRAHAYYSGAVLTKVMLAPEDLAVQSIGHFDLFHARHASGFWLDTLLWLRDGINPWPNKVFV
ncbi:alpha/beta hydrolase family protein [Rhizobium sp.]